MIATADAPMRKQIWIWIFDFDPNGKTLRDPDPVQFAFHVRHTGGR